MAVQSPRSSRRRGSTKPAAEPPATDPSTTDAAATEAEPVCVEAQVVTDTEAPATEAEEEDTRESWEKARDAADQDEADEAAAGILAAAFVNPQDPSTAANSTEIAEDVDPGAPIACLPAIPLHIAAQFTSDDPHKDVLSVIQCMSVTNEKGSFIRIQSTNGTHAVRMDVPADDYYFVGAADGFLFMDGKGLRPKGKVHLCIPAVIFDDSRINFLGNVKKGANTNGVVEIRPIEVKPQGFEAQYPNLDFIFDGGEEEPPEEDEEGNPKPPEHFPTLISASLLSVTAKMAGAFGTGSLLSFNSMAPNKPARLGFDLSIGHLEVTAEVIIMPTVRRAG